MCLPLSGSATYNFENSIMGVALIAEEKSKIKLHDGIIEATVFELRKLGDKSNTPVFSYNVKTKNIYQ